MKVTIQSNILLLTALMIMGQIQETKGMDVDEPDQYNADHLHALMHTLHGQGTVSALAFSPDNKTLASGHWDCKIRIWHKTNDHYQHIQDIHEVALISAMAFSPDGNILAYSTPFHIGIFKKDILTHRYIFLEELKNGNSVKSLAFNSNGILISASGDSTARGAISLWQQTNGHYTCIQTLNTYDSVTSAIISADNTTVACIIGYWTVLIYQIESDSNLLNPKFQRLDTRGSIEAITFKKDGLLAIALQKGFSKSTVEFWKKLMVNIE